MEKLIGKIREEFDIDENNRIIEDKIIKHELKNKHTYVFYEVGNCANIITCYIAREIIKSKKYIVEQIYDSVVEHRKHIDL